MLKKMRRYVGVGAAWLGATAISVLIASAAVAGIRDRVVETPVAIGLPTSTTTIATPQTSTVDPDPETTGPAPTTSTTTSTTVTTSPPSTTTSTTSETGETSPATTTTTTAPPPTTTTTTAPPPTTTTTTGPLAYPTYDLTGGTVVLAFGNGEVNLVSATPRAGFSADYEHTGPVEVEVKFVSNDHKSKLEAHVDNGELRVDIEEEPHDDDD